MTRVGGELVTGNYFAALGASVRGSRSHVWNRDRRRARRASGGGRESRLLAEEVQMLILRWWDI